MIIVTGASGHVGGNLVRELLERGHPVRALLHKDERALEGVDVEKAWCDIRDGQALRSVFKGGEVVYHTAAHISLLMSDWPRLNEINVLGTRNVVEACLSCGVRRLVHFSSIHALCQEPLTAPVDEERPYADSRQNPPYDRSKAAGEKEVAMGIQKGLDAIIINPTGIIGPLDFRPSHTGEMLLSLARGTLPALVTGGFNWVDIRDVVKGVLCAEKLAPAGARYILGGHWVSIHDIASQVAEITGIRSPRLTFPIWLAHLVTPFTTALARIARKRPLYTTVSLRALQSNRYISHARAARDLAYQPRPFAETIKDTVTWFYDNGWLSRTGGAA